MWMGQQTQFRMLLVLFLFTNMLIVYTLGLRPVLLVKLGAVLDGLLMAPLQALWLGAGLYVLLPRLLSADAWRILRPHWGFAAGLLVALLAFGYFCVLQVLATP
jgi:hypothetical protein